MNAHDIVHIHQTCFDVLAVSININRIHPGSTMRRSSSDALHAQVIDKGIPIHIERTISNDRLAEVADTILTPAGMDTEELGLPANRDASEDASELYIP